MNVSKLARQLNVTTTELLDKLPELGFSIGRRAIKIDERQVDKIIAAWKRQQKLEAINRSYQQITEVRGKVDGNEKSKEITIGSSVVIKELAEKMGLSLAKVMGEVMKNGIMASLNERLDFETATIIAEDLGFKVNREQDSEESHELSQKEKLQNVLADRQKNSVRPPVVVVMGHVDHGKTKLLDAIRKTNIIDDEAGGITQHIGAYQTKVTKDGKDRIVTFLDTPGHEAFKAMRSRGGQVADVAILVVAADDGLQPQTLESIAIIQKEKLPFIVAINKMDKEGADIERVKGQLAEINLQPEDWGGKTICVPISAKKGQGIEDVLDMILLVADMENLQADEGGEAVGTIIESHMDKNEGPVATVLIQAGILKINDLVTVGQIAGKIKSMKTWTGADLRAATPGTPVKILGLKNVAQVGDMLQVTLDIKSFKQSLKNQPSKRTTPKSTQNIRNEDNDDTKIPTLNLIIRADVLGSLEAIEESLLKLNSPKSKVKIIRKGLGFITENDILMAESTGAVLIAFTIKTSRATETMAQEKKVELLQYDIIYKLLEEMERRLKSMQEPDVIRTYIGKLEVLAIFKQSGKSTILGGKVLDGKVTNPSVVKVMRGENVITFGRLSDLEANKEKMTEVVSGNQVGMKFDGEPVIVVGDTLEFFLETQKKNV